MESPKKVFRTAVGGYNKQDVNDYITSLINDYERSTAELTARIDELEAASDAEKELIPTDVTSEHEKKLEVELERANNLISEQNGTMEALREELEGLKSELNKKGSELSQANEKLSLYADSDDKLRDYARVSSKLGDIMLAAASNADRIKADAESSAKQTIFNAEERERELNTRYENRAAELEAAYRSACAAIDRKLAEYAESAIGELSDTLTRSSDELCAQLELQKSKLRGVLSRDVVLPEELTSLKRLDESDACDTEADRGDK